MTTNNGFDIANFNKEFEEKQTKYSAIKSQTEKTNLNKLSREIKKKLLHQLSIGEILINMKDTIFGIYTDFLFLDYKDILTKENRLFYIGILLILIALIIKIISYIFLTYEKKSNNESKIQYVYNIYKDIIDDKIKPDDNIKKILPSNKTKSPVTIPSVNIQHKVTTQPVDIQSIK